MYFLLDFMLQYEYMRYRYMHPKCFYAFNSSIFLVCTKSSKKKIRRLSANQYHTLPISCSHSFRLTHCLLCIQYNSIFEIMLRRRSCHHLSEILFKIQKSKRAVYFRVKCILALTDTRTHTRTQVHGKFMCICLI